MTKLCLSPRELCLCFLQKEVKSCLICCVFPYLNSLSVAPWFFFVDICCCGLVGCFPSSLNEGSAVSYSLVCTAKSCFIKPNEAVFNKTSVKLYLVCSLFDSVMELLFILERKLRVQTTKDRQSSEVLFHGDLKWLCLECCLKDS